MDSKVYIESAKAPNDARHDRTRGLVTAALIAALLCASAMVQIPLQPVPVTLQMLLVVVAALLLTPLQAAAAVGTYLLIGAAGIPVFAGGQGGLGVIAGPTGGYLVGFLAGAVIGSTARAVAARVRLGEATGDVVAACTTVVTVYVVGTVRLAQVAGLTPQEALLAGALPFVAPDLVKAAVAVTIARAVRRARRG